MCISVHVLYKIEGKLFEGYFSGISIRDFVWDTFEGLMHLDSWTNYLIALMFPQD